MGTVGTSAQWSWGLLRRRTWILVGMARTVALAVAFVSPLGAFVATSQSSLTERAARSVASTGRCR